MKNIHILPTENESRLRYNSFNKVYELCEFPKYHTDIKSTHNIYITSDEEIKVGDWVLDTLTKKITKNKGFLKGMSDEKIILTTEQDLIDDGVQAIDDEFLEWFVKNPNCEEIEVVRDSKQSTNSNGFLYIEWLDYKIILPKEVLKQETLEEAVQKVANSDDFINGALFGSQWQQERMYSEEDIVLILSKFRDMKMIAFSEWFEQFKKK